MGEDIGEDAAGVALRGLGLRKGGTFEYRYDFGDGWEIEIVVERRRQKPGPEWNMCGSTSGTTGRMTDIHPVEGPARDLLDEVGRAVAVGALARPFDLPFRSVQAPAPDMVLELPEVWRPVARRVREAVEQTLRYVLGREEAPTSEELVRMAERLRGETDGVLKTRGREPGPHSREERGEALKAAGELVREMGLEHLDLDLMLGRRREGGGVMAAGPVHGLTAHIWLLGRVFQRLGTVLMGHPSPGMVFLSGRGGLAETVGETLRKGRFALPAAIRVESLVSALLGEKTLPRPLAPADSPLAARELLQALADALEDAGLTEEVSAEEADPELVRQAQASDVASVSYRRYDLDTSTNAWMKALLEYRGPSRAGPRKRRKRGGR